MSRMYDVAVVGGGIVGLAHAWMASRRGLRVVLFERSKVAAGASVRNFGMIWPIGQPAGDRYRIACRSRDLWLELGKRGALPVSVCGSIHLAHAQDELAVLEEFCAQGTHGGRMIRPDEVLRRVPRVCPEGLCGGMWSESELRVDPRTAAHRIARFLVSAASVEAHFGTLIRRVEGTDLVTSDGRKFRAGRTVVCGGHDVQTLYPEILAASPLVPCKLQMMRSAGHDDMSFSTPHLASGLTLRHYESFASCPTLPALRERIASENPQCDRYGIHVMVSAFEGGELVLGDSHQYGDAISPFDNEEIDQLILRELRRIIHLDDGSIRSRWSGIYAKVPARAVLERSTPDGNHLFLGTGGAGMTMAFGLVEDAWKRWTGE